MNSHRFIEEENAMLKERIRDLEFEITLLKNEVWAQREMKKAAQSFIDERLTSTKKDER